MAGKKDHTFSFVACRFEVFEAMGYEYLVEIIECFHLYSTKYLTSVAPEVPENLLAHLKDFSCRFLSAIGEAEVDDSLLACITHNVVSDLSKQAAEFQPPFAWKNIGYKDQATDKPV